MAWNTEIAYDDEMTLKWEALKLDFRLTTSAKNKFNSARLIARKT